LWRGTLPQTNPVSQTDKHTPTMLTVRTTPGTIGLYGK
jgi:hypothetical protein